MNHQTHSTTNKKAKLPPVRVVNAVNKIRGGLGKAFRKLAPPNIVLFEAISQMWTSQAISVAARFGIADVLKDGRMSYQEIAVKVGAHPESLYRLMRGLTVSDIFTEHEGGVFSLTPVGQFLREDVPGNAKSMAIFQGQYQWAHWGDLFHSIKTGETSIEGVRGGSLFDFMKKTPDAQHHFDLFMTTVSSMEIDSVLAAYSFGPFSTIADIGGGHGSFLKAILESHPGARGILFDQPHVIEAAKRHWTQTLAGRCNMVGGSFYETIPSGADAYVMKHIIHDWSKELCLQILSGIRKVIPSHGKLILVETVVPPPGVPHFSKMLDLEMLVNVGGKERTPAEYEKLFQEAGFKLERVVPTISLASVIEASPV